MILEFLLLSSVGLLVGAPAGRNWFKIGFLKFFLIFWQVNFSQFDIFGIKSSSLSLFVSAMLPIITTRGKDGEAASFPDEIDSE